MTTPQAKYSESLHVAHVVLSLDPGGLERIVVDLVREGQRLGQRVSIVCLERPGVLAEQSQALGASVHCIHKQPGLRFGTFSRLRRLFQEIRPDVVHTHQIAALFYAGRAARRAGVPIVIHSEHGKHYAPRFRTRMLGCWAARSAQAFCCVSKDIASEVAACRIAPAAKVRVVTNGINTAAFATPSDTAGLRRKLCFPDHARIVGTIGRLTEIKRQDLLIEAFALLRQRVPQAHLVIVGGGPRHEELLKLSERLGLSASVHLAGYQEHPEQFLHLMEVFALTSRSEGMPLSVLEAWAASVPVVAAHVGGLPELIAHGRTGLLFPSGDARALADLLHVVLTRPELSAQLRQAGLERVNRDHTLYRMACEYEQLYRSLLPTGGQRKSPQLAPVRSGAVGEDWASAVAAPHPHPSPHRGSVLLTPNGEE